MNLTRFPLLFPERRQFFVEQAGTFEVRTGESDLLFHSRRVGLTATGDAVRLLGGARLAGRIGAWDVGFFDAQMGKSAGAEAANLGVLRARRAFGDSRSWLGVMMTSRAASDSAQAAVGVDGELHVAGDDYLSLAAVTLLGEPGAGVNEGVLPRGALRLPPSGAGTELFYRAGVATTGAALRARARLRRTRRRHPSHRRRRLRPRRLVGGTRARTSVTSAFVYRNAARHSMRPRSRRTWSWSCLTGGVATLSATQQDDALPFRSRRHRRRTFPRAGIPRVPRN